MFKFYDSKPYVTDLFVASAVCADETVRAAMQNGGFVFITNNGKGQTPTANIPVVGDDAGVNVLNRKLVYPVFIPRKADPANNFYPIQADGLISYIDDSNYTGYVDTDSYSTSGGALAAGVPLMLATVDSVAKLILGDGTLATTVAYCLAAPSDNEMKIKWIGC